MPLTKVNFINIDGVSLNISFGLTKVDFFNLSGGLTKVKLLNNNSGFSIKVNHAI